MSSKRGSIRKGGGSVSAFETAYAGALTAAHGCDCEPCRTLRTRSALGKTAHNRPAPARVRRRLLRRWRCEVAPIESEFTGSEPAIPSPRPPVPPSPVAEAAREFVPARRAVDPRPALDAAIREAREREAKQGPGERDAMRVPDDWLLGALRKALYSRVNGEVVLPHGAMGRIARQWGEPHHRVRRLARAQGLRVGYGEQREFALELMLDEADDAGVLPHGMLGRVCAATGMSYAALRRFLYELRTRDGIALWGTRSGGRRYARALMMLRAAADEDGRCPRGTFARVARATGCERHGVNKLAREHGFHVWARSDGA